MYLAAGASHSPKTIKSKNYSIDLKVVHNRLQALSFGTHIPHWWTGFEAVFVSTKFLSVPFSYPPAAWAFPCTRSNHLRNELKERPAKDYRPWLVWIWRIRLSKFSSLSLNRCCSFSYLSLANDNERERVNGFLHMRTVLWWIEEGNNHRWTFFPGKQGIRFTCLVLRKVCILLRACKLYIPFNSGEWTSDAFTYERNI